MHSWLCASRHMTQPHSGILSTPHAIHSVWATTPHNLTQAFWECHVHSSSCVSNHSTSQCCAKPISLNLRLLSLWIAGILLNMQRFLSYGSRMVQLWISKTLIFFCHHSSAHKCQISLSLDCTVSDYLIWNCAIWIADLSFINLKKSVIKLYLWIKIEFPTIPEIALNILLAVFTMYLWKSKFLTLNIIKSQHQSSLKTLRMQNAYGVRYLEKI